MKKISTLALALIAMGSLSMPASAQVKFEPVSTPTLESGWYQMRQVVGVTRKDISATAPRYVYSAETAKNGKYYFASDAAQKSDATAFVYVDNTDGKYAIKSINGKWGDFVAISSNTKPATYDITQVDKNNPTQYRVGTKSYWEDWQNWNYIAGSQNSGNARFEFSKVNPADNYDVYSVVAAGDFNPKTMQITVTNTLETNKGTKTVYNGGSFFFTKGTTVTQDNFTVVDDGTTGYSKTVKFDATAKTLVVEYTLDDKENKYVTLLTSSKADVAKTGVGLPKAESEARTTLNAAITAFESDKTYEKYVALSEAQTAYYKSTDVLMPEDGKVYVITNVQQDGTCYYFSYSTSRLSAVSDKTKAAQFVCRVVDGKYVFVNVEDGKYLVVAAKNNAGTNSGKGYIESYDAKWADLTLKKNSILSCFNIGGKRSETGKPQEGNFIVDKKDGAFNGWDMTELNRADCTTAFKLEEVSYPNTVTFNTVTDVEGVNNLATFSAPFATVIPEGVTAYYVSTADNTKATMKAIEAGKAIPANAGVILTSTTGTEATMIPATTETAAELTGNKLGNSAGAAKTIAAGDNAYILAKGDNGTAFYKGKVGTTLGMNKAYLTLNVAGAEQAISMNFGGNVTGINQIVNAEQNNAPVYDLTGRRVVRTVKGGLYIKGGNKFIAR
ncbi:hypothetical protein [uncultured Prevotellamassilia sp.]|uniref:hypothetical protein n=1 Tax=uncultured Prevotellamassilia sp. TaxID=1926676 RepID=UPI0025993CB7|nr:hypothetical protein [uncultured Prevotellamassilia sp.]